MLRGINEVGEKMRPLARAMTVDRRPPSVPDRPISPNHHLLRLDTAFSKYAKTILPPISLPMPIKICQYPIEMKLGTIKRAVAINAALQAMRLTQIISHEVI